MLTYFCITQQGERHIEQDMPCQDYSASRRIRMRDGQELVFAAIADGVGSCAYSHIGAKTAVCTFLSVLEEGLLKKNTLDDKAVLELFHQGFSEALIQTENTALEKELPFIEFDTTLTGALFDGKYLWYGHIGDDGIIAEYTDGRYEMLTCRHKGEEVNSVFPLRCKEKWQFGKAPEETAVCVLMTDGCLDYCVDTEAMSNRIYFPFLEPVLTTPLLSDEEAEKCRKDWEEFFSGSDIYGESFRKKVTDDITFAVIQNPEAVGNLPEISFDIKTWNRDTKKRKKELEKRLYGDFYEFIKKVRRKTEE